MEVRADITAEDRRALHRHRRAVVGSRRRFWLEVALWLAAVTVFTWLYTATTLRPGYIVSTALGFAAGLVVRALWSRERAPVDVAEEPPHAIEVVLEAEGLRLRRGLVETRVPSAAVAEVSETAEHVFVAVEGMPEIVLPKRAFASEAEVRTFVEALRPPA